MEIVMKRRLIEFSISSKLFKHFLKIQIHLHTIYFFFKSIKVDIARILPFVLLDSGLNSFITDNPYFREKKRV